MNLRLLALASLAALSMTMIAPAASANTEDVIASPPSDSSSPAVLDSNVDSQLLTKVRPVSWRCSIVSTTIYGQTIYVWGVGKVETYDQRICI